MALALYLIGAPRCGKTAVFDALTHTPEGPNFAVKGGHRYGMVKVPDGRLAALRDLYKPKKYTPAEVTFVDVTPPGGEAAKFGEVTGLLGTADALVLVVQAFGEFDGAGQPLDSAAQMESVLLELAVCDLEKIERRLERIEHDRQRSGKAPEVEVRALQRCKEQLEKEQPLRTLAFREDEEKILRTFQFLSLKPLLVVADIAEDRLDGSGLDALEAAAAARGLTLLRFCAPLESEIASLDPAAQADFLKDYGLAEPARMRLIHAAYRTLKLASFFTVGEDEVRAWTIAEGAVAQAAAGKIHTDMEKGFIRAETVAAESLLKAGAWSKCREEGSLRLEGKEYVVRDGDVINFRFGA